MERVSFVLKSLNLTVNLFCLMVDFPYELINCLSEPVPRSYPKADMFSKTWPCVSWVDYLFNLVLDWWKECD